MSTSPAADRLPVSLCIINYNGAHYLPSTLEAVLAMDPAPAELLLIDNASTDDGPTLVAARYPQVRIVRRAHNEGPGAARDTGTTAARFDRVFFIDNDVAPEPGCLAALCRVLDRDPQAVCVMPRVVHADPPDRVQFDGVTAHLLGMNVLCNQEQPRAVLRTETRPVASLVTAAFLFDRGRWGSEPPFDEALFLYLEDHEFGLRAGLLGHRIYSTPNAVCIHREGTRGLSLRATGQYTPMRVSQTILNRWQLLIKLYRPRTFLLYLPSFLTFEMMQLLGAVTRGWLCHYLRAAGALLRGARSLLIRRREFQRRRRRDELELVTLEPLPFNAALARGRLDRMAQTLLRRLLHLNHRLVSRRPPLRHPASAARSGHSSGGLNGT